MRRGRRELFGSAAGGGFLSLSLRLGDSLCGCKIPMIDCYFIPLLSAVNSALPLTDDTFARLSIMGLFKCV